MTQPPKLPRYFHRERAMRHEPITALIPIKAHSERVVNKNSRLFCGEPLFHWIIKELTRSQYINEVLVDTDSNEIAHAAQSLGAQVIMRPKHLLGDMIGINPLIENQIRHCKNDLFLQTHTTNPLLRAETVDSAVEEFFRLRKNHDSLFSVTEIRSRYYWPDGTPINHQPDNMLRTQDLPPIFEENSNFYVFSRESFNRFNHRIGAKPVMFPVPKLDAIDIDYEEDFELAQALMNIRLNKKPKRD